MLTDKIEDNLLHQIDLSNTDSIRTMIERYAGELPEAKQARISALSSISRRRVHSEYWEATTTVRTAMYRRADVIGSFTAHVVYDTAVAYVFDELLAVYSCQDLSTLHYDALHAAWRCQLDALSANA